MTQLLIAASGTGGHLFPAIAVAERLCDSWQITWLGVPNRLETSLVPSKYKLVTVNAGGLQARGWRKILEFFQLVLTIKDVYRLIKAKSIDIVFTTGGYISAPAIVAAKLCKIPVILHESNALPGRVTRLLGRFCDQVALGIPTSKKYLPGVRTLFTGTPVRKSFFKLYDLPSWIPKGDGHLIVITGGSQGALGINRMLEKVLPFLLANGCRVIHLTGKNEIQMHKLVHENYFQKSFSNEIAGLFQHADLVISRAGASVLSELSVTKTPAILIPYPYAKDNHQEFNAAYFAEVGAAVIVHQETEDGNSLHRVLSNLLQTDLTQIHEKTNNLILMRKGMEKVCVKDSSSQVISLIENSLT